LYFVAFDFIFDQMNVAIPSLYSYNIDYVHHG